MIRFMHIKKNVFSDVFLLSKKKLCYLKRKIEKRNRLRIWFFPRNHPTLKKKILKKYYVQNYIWNLKKYIYN
jgi:hypothetical protein